MPPSQAPSAGASTPDDDSAVADSMISLVDISPPANSSLQRNFSIVARVKYRVSTKGAERYKLSAKFQQKDGKTLFDGSFPDDEYLFVDAREGTVEMSFPLKYVWDDPNLGDPIRVCYVLANQVAPHRSRIVARTDFVSYSRADSQP